MSTSREPDDDGASNGAPRPPEAARRVLLLGLGDLGRRLALALAAGDGVDELVLAGRAGDGPALAHLTAACGRARVHFRPLDLLDEEAVGRALHQVAPALVVQCASLWSPWWLAERADPLAQALGRAGFALHLPAQLPAITTLMRAARAVGLSVPVINCSYPDVTHPVLARLGLSPLIGVGNAGMIQALVTAALRPRNGASNGVAPARVRVLAHHGHLPAVLRADPARLGSAPPPRVYLGDEGARLDELAFAGPPLPSSPALNALTAAHAAALARALLPGGTPLYTSAPGPLGLAGGLPVRVAPRDVALDLPPGLALDEAVRFARASATLDGVAAIGDDGTVTFTAAAEAALATLAPELARPLHPDEAGERAALVRRLLARDA